MSAVNTVDNTYLGKLSSNNTEYSIDVVLVGEGDYYFEKDGTLVVTKGKENAADTIEVLAGSNGTVLLTSINFINENQTNQGIIQVLKGDLQNSNITLELSDALKDKTWDYSIDKYVVDNVNDVVSVIYTDFIGTKGLRLAQYDKNLKDGIFDAIEITSTEPSPFNTWIIPIYA